MPIFLAERATGVRELMEDPACDPDKLRNTYAQFRSVNTLVSDWRRIYRSYLRPVRRADGGRVTVLDIGFGGGDIPVRLARWAERDGLALEITAIDTDRRALAWVEELDAPRAITFREASLAELLARGERFDAVISNHLLHHLTEPELARLCAETERLSRNLVIHNDIVRSDLAYLSFAALTAPFFRASYIVADGLTSIRRSFTRGELRRLAPPGWRVERAFPCHQLLVFERPGPGSPNPSEPGPVEVD